MSRQAARSLDDLKTQFRELSEQATALVNRLEPTLLFRRPKPESWSVAECFAHLNLSANAYFPVWKREFARARDENRSGEGPYRLDFWGRMLVWTLEPPPKFRLRTAAAFQPAAIGAPETILPAFRQRQQGILEALEAARGIAIDKIKIASPFDARVRYSIWSSFRVNAVHERRHIWQAKQAAQALAR